MSESSTLGWDHVLAGLKLESNHHGEGETIENQKSKISDLIYLEDSDCEPELETHRYRSNIRRKQRKIAKKKITDLENELIKEEKIIDYQFDLGVAENIDFEKVLRTIPKISNFRVAPERKPLPSEDLEKSVYGQLIRQATSEKRKEI
jgi:hypothetical protein